MVEVPYQAVTERPGKKLSRSCSHFAPGIPQMPGVKDRQSTIMHMSNRNRARPSPVPCTCRLNRSHSERPLP